MYYRLYRRRHIIYLVVCMIIVIYFLTGSSNNTNNDNQPNNDKKSKVLGNRDRERRSRISIETYKEPPPCRGCPGENGGGVTLNVLFLN